MLALMRAGAPNIELLAAKTVEDLIGVAQRHGIPLPALGSLQHGEGGGEERSPTGGKSVADSSDAGGVDPPVVSGAGGTYEGERNEDGMWEGVGTYTFADGSLYQGQWLRNQQWGAPESLPRLPDLIAWREIAPTLRYYVTSLAGVGTFWYASGNRYHGQWRAGKKHGHGTFGYADGRVEVGTYKDDADVGEGAMWSSDRRTAWRIVQDGLEVAEVSLEEAKQIELRIGEPVPLHGD